MFVLPAFISPVPSSGPAQKSVLNKYLLDDKVMDNMVHLCDTILFTRYLCN